MDSKKTAKRIREIKSNYKTLGIDSEQTRLSLDTKSSQYQKASITEKSVHFIRAGVNSDELEDS